MHIYLDNTIYFISARTWQKIKYFDTPDRKKILINQIKNSAKEFDIRIYAWVVLSNHYHILFRVVKKEHLSKYIQAINGGSSFGLQKFIGRGHKIWHHYKDWGIRNEKMFYQKLNYIHNNPVKHGLVRRMVDYKFSSYQVHLKRIGSEVMYDILSRYPVRKNEYDHLEI